MTPTEAAAALLRAMPQPISPPQLEEAASRIEDLGLVSPDDRQKLLVLLIDYAPAAEYGRLLDEVG